MTTVGTLWLITDAGVVLHACGPLDGLEALAARYEDAKVARTELAPCCTGRTDLACAWDVYDLDGEDGPKTLVAAAALARAEGRRHVYELLCGDLVAHHRRRRST